MNDIELCYYLATEILRLFRRHELSPVELLEAQIRRAEHVEPIINAFTDTFYEQALKKAKAAETRSYDDKRVFQLAAAIEKARPWLDCAAHRPNL